MCGTYEVEVIVNGDNSVVGGESEVTSEWKV